MASHLHDTDINTSAHQHFNTFFGCDWGTSSFRLRWVALPSLEVLGEVSNDRGVVATFRAWKGLGDESTRMDFFRGVIRDGVAEIEEQVGRSLAGVPLIISGMASSSVGMITLPYGFLPLAGDGSNLVMHKVGADERFPFDTLIVSGIRSADDVMRGEETQLIGALTQSHAREGARLFIFPGTHSKHVEVINGEARAFRTYMTGEFFELLSKKSILSDSIAPSTSSDVDDMRHFETGITEGSRHNILNSVFHVRTRALFGEHSKEMNYHFLSGLLIGAEVAALGDRRQTPVTILGDGPLLTRYKFALQHQGIESIDVVGNERATVQGQWQIMRRAGIIS